MEDEGIRSCGPGKFIDSWAYELALEGGADEEESYEDGGWVGLLWLNEDDKDYIRDVANEELTSEEEELLDKSVAVILFKQSDIEADWFNSEADAEEAWENIQAESEN